jgi:L-cysteine S-thiosulfotransferase
MKSLFLTVCLCMVHMLCAADTRTSGNVYLSAQLQALQADTTRNPVVLWQERGQSLWQSQCQACHGNITTLSHSAATFPRLTPDGKTVLNLEDKITQCQTRPYADAASGKAAGAIEDDDVLALSAALHQAATGQRIHVSAAGPHSAADAPPSAAQEARWQERLRYGKQLYQTRMGRINLACMHCHDQKVGAQMRADTISQGHPTGFPIYRLSWQTLGSVERRLRACYSGVQAHIPGPGSPDLRDLELFMKVRANGMPIDGPSIRR